MVTRKSSGKQPESEPTRSIIDNSNLSELAAPEKDLPNAEQLRTSGKSPAWDSDEPADYAALRAPGFMNRKRDLKKAASNNIACRRCSPHEYVRIWPGENNGWEYPIIKDRDNKDRVYIVPDPDTSRLAKHIAYAEIWLVQNNSGDLFFVVSTLCTYSGIRYEAWESFRTEFSKAADQWIQITWNGNQRCFEGEPSEYPIPDPIWPADINYGALFGAAFKGLVLYPGHPYRTKLLGGSTSQNGHPV